MKTWVEKNGRTAASFYTCFWTLTNAGWSSPVDAGAVTAKSQPCCRRSASRIIQRMQVLYCTNPCQDLGRLLTESFNNARNPRIFSAFTPHPKDFSASSPTTTQRWSGPFRWVRSTYFSLKFLILLLTYTKKASVTLCRKHRLPLACTDLLTSEVEMSNVTPWSISENLLVTDSR